MTDRVRETPPTTAPITSLGNAMHWVPSEHEAPPGLGSQKETK